MDTDVQEAMTVALSVNETFLGQTLRKIKKDMGSTKRYLNEKLQLSERQCEKLKAILLF
jgi:protein tyrosine/serine phosphatase